MSAVPASVRDQARAVLAERELARRAEARAEAEATAPPSAGTPAAEGAAEALRTARVLLRAALKSRDVGRVARAVELTRRCAESAARVRDIEADLRAARRFHQAIMAAVLEFAHAAPPGAGRALLERLKRINEEWSTAMDGGAPT